MINRRWFVALIALALGAVLGFVQAPYHFYLAIVAWPATYELAARSRRDFTVGYCFGLGYFFHTMSWIAEPFAVGPPQYANLGFLAWVLMAASLALFWWPLFWFRRFGWWAVALGYLIMEGVRAVIFTGLPWGLMAHGFIDTPLAQSAAFIGTFLLSAILVFGALALAVVGIGWRSRLIAFLVVGSLALPYVLRDAPAHQIADDYDITVVQANLPNLTHYDSAQFKTRLDTHIALSKSPSDLVIWPEASTEFLPASDAGFRDYVMNGIGSDAIILGASTIEGDKFYNSAFVYTHDGQTSRYDKRHLVPFGEYIPLGDWLLARGFFVQTVTTYAGRKGDTRPWEIDETIPKPIILICYEGIFPWLSRQDGDYLVQITSDIWFGDRSGPYQHLDIARYRAIENGMPLVRAAKTGVSAFVDANGQVIAAIPLNTQGRLTQNLGPRYDNTFYRQWGEASAIMVALLGLVVLVFTAERRARPQ